MGWRQAETLDIGGLAELQKSLQFGGHLSFIWFQFKIYGYVPNRGLEERDEEEGEVALGKLEGKVGTGGASLSMLGGLYCW